MVLTAPGGDTPLCDFIKSSNAKLPRDVAEKIVAYEALKALEEAGAGSALYIINKALERGLRSPRLVSLQLKLKSLTDLSTAMQALYESLDTVIRDINNGFVPEADIKALEAALRRAEEAYAEAGKAGVSLPGREGLDLAADLLALAPLYNMASQVEERVADFLSRLTGEVTSLSKSGSVEDFAGKLVALGTLMLNARSLRDSVYNVLARLESLSPHSQLAREKIVEPLVKALKGMLHVLDDLVEAGGPLASAGGKLADLLSLVNNAYTSEETGPFAGENQLRQRAIQDIQDILVRIKLLKGIAEREKASGESLPAKMSEAFNALAEALENILKQLKMTTTYSDYRWNKIWETAEKEAGLDLGDISVRDYLKYIYDPKTGKLEERPGISGHIISWIAEHAPEEVLKIWVGIEDFLKNVTEYNEYAMNHARNPLAKAAGAIGYVGANALTMIAQLAAPQMLLENLGVLGGLAKKWVKSIIDLSGKELRETASETWRMFFGSKEAALATLAGILLGFAAGALAMKVLPRGGLAATILERLMSGDVIGAGLAVLEEIEPIAELRAAVGAALREGAIRAVDLLDREGILRTALERAKKLGIVNKIARIARIDELVKKSLKESKDLEEARRGLAEAIRKRGFEEVEASSKDLIEAAGRIRRELEELKVHAPIAERFKAILEKIRKGEKPEEAPEPLREKLEAVDREAVGERLAEAESEGALKVLRELAQEGVVEKPEVVTDVLDHLSEAERLFREQGKARIADAIRRLRESIEENIVETARLKRLETALDRLESIRRRAEEAGLWREEVELEARKLRPGKGWLKKVKARPGEVLDRLREEIDKALEERIGKVNKVLEAGKKIKAELSLEGVRVSRSALEPIAEALRELGFEDEASKVLEMAGEKKPLAVRLGEAMQRLGEAIARKAGEALEKAESTSLEKLESEAGLRSKALELIRKGYREAFVKAYLAGLRLAERLGDILERLGEKLTAQGLERAEARLVSTLAKALKREFKEARAENLGFLEGLMEGLEGLEKTPYGRALAELIGSIRETVKVMSEKLPSNVVRLSVEERLARIFSPESAKFRAVAEKLGGEIEELAREYYRVLEDMSEAENLAEYISEAENLSSEPGITLADIEKAFEAAPEDARPLLERYTMLRKLKTDLDEFVEKLQKKEPITVEDIQMLADELAAVDTELAALADWHSFKSLLEDTLAKMREMEGLPGEVAARLEEAEGKIEKAITVKPEEKPLIMEYRKTFEKAGGILANSLDRLVEDFKEVLGEDRVKRFEELVSRFKEKLRKGEFDVETLKEIRGELRKLKLKALPAKVKADLLGLYRRLREAAARLKGPGAAAIEKAFNRLSDVIREIEEKTPEVEKGWVHIDRLIRASKGRLLEVNEDVAEQVARILRERERTFEVERGGVKFKVRRTIDIEGDGTLHVRYEFEFPEGRRVIVDEVARATKSGEIYRYRRVWYDPETARAIEAYREAVEEGRPLEGEALEGKRIIDALSEDIAEIDPDYEVLRRIGVVVRGGFKPLLPASLVVAQAILGAIGAPRVPGVGRVSAKPVKVSLKEKLVEELAETGIGRELAGHLLDILEGKATIDEMKYEVVLKPYLDALKGLMELLLPAGEVEPLLRSISRSLPERLEEDFGGLEYAIVLRDLDGLSIEIPGVGRPVYKSVVIAVPPPSVSFFEKMKRLGVAKLTYDDTTIYIPVDVVGNNIVIVLPPVAVEPPSFPGKPAHHVPEPLTPEIIEELKRRIILPSGRVKKPTRLPPPGNIEREVPKPKVVMGVGPQEAQAPATVEVEKQKPAQPVPPRPVPPGEEAPSPTPVPVPVPAPPAPVVLPWGALAGGGGRAYGREWLNI